MHLLDHSHSDYSLVIEFLLEVFAKFEECHRKILGYFEIEFLLEMLLSSLRNE